jgi:hypothetical protein
MSIFLNLSLIKEGLTQYSFRRAQCEVYLSLRRGAASPVLRSCRVTERASILDLLIGRLTLYALARLGCLRAFDTVNYFI